MSEREKVLAEMAEAEKQAADDYQGTGGRLSHLSGAVIGFAWSPEAEEALKQLGVEETSKLLVVVSTMPSRMNWLTVTLVRLLKHQAKRYNLSHSKKPRPIR